MIAAAAAILAMAAPAADLTCPIMGSAVGKDAKAMTVSGVTFKFCCGGCDTKFAKDPNTYVAKAAKENKVIGEFLFDPTTGKAIKAEKSKGTADYNGIRYYFASEEGAASFTKEPKKFTKPVTKESLFCPVMKVAVKDYKSAKAYGHYEGTRYYQCCLTCLKKMSRSPEKYAMNAKDKLVDVKLKAKKAG
jgi:YHS domain-containing protein